MDSASKPALSWTNRQETNFVDIAKCHDKVLLNERRASSITIVYFTHYFTKKKKNCLIVSIEYLNDATISRNWTRDQ